MHADRQLQFVDLPELLEDELGEPAGVAEDDRGAMRLDLGHHLRHRIDARMARPGHASFGEQDGDVGIGAFLALHQGHGIDVAMRREPGAIAVGVGHRRRQRYPAHSGCEPLEPRHRQRQQIAALAGGEGVDLVDHHRLQPREHIEAVFVGKQQAQRLGRGEQYLGRPRALADLALMGRVAGPGLDADRKAHLLDRREQIALDVDRERLERRDVERVEALARSLDQLGQGRQEAGERLARAGGGDEQCVLAGVRGVEHIELVLPGAPAATREPIGKDLR